MFCTIEADDKIIGFCALWDRLCENYPERICLQLSARVKVYYSKKKKKKKKKKKFSTPFCLSFYVELFLSICYVIVTDYVKHTLFLTIC